MADAAELKAMCGNASVGWSKEATRQSHALDLEPGIFKSDNPMRIAASLLQSSQRSMRRKRSAYGSAMAMLCFYINRAGVNLSEERRDVLQQAKLLLKQLADGDIK
jgi:hypothetical protein